MGTDYHFKAIVGVAVDEDNFFTSEKTEFKQDRTKCGHPLGATDQYCPTCGERARPGTRIETVYTLRPHWAERFVKGYDSDIDSMSELAYECSLRDSAFRVIEFRQGRLWIFGKLLADYNVRTGSQPEILSEGFQPELIKHYCTQVNEYVRPLGIKAEARFFTGIMID